MLAALLQNNNNGRQTQPGFKVDPRASAGRSRAVDHEESPWLHYDVADVVAAAAAFQEVPGEDPAIRTARLYRWISVTLPHVKEAREKRDAAMLLVGARLADAAAEERHAEQTRLKIEQIVEIINEVRRETETDVPAPRRAAREHERGERLRDGTGSAFLGGLVVGGIVVGLGILLHDPPRRPRRRPR